MLTEQQKLEFNAALASENPERIKKAFQTLIEYAVQGQSSHNETQGQRLTEIYTLISATKRGTAFFMYLTNESNQQTFFEQAELLSFCNACLARAPASAVRLQGAIIKTRAETLKNILGTGGVDSIRMQLNQTGIGVVLEFLDSTNEDLNLSTFRDETRKLQKSMVAISPVASLFYYFSKKYEKEQGYRNTASGKEKMRLFQQLLSDAPLKINDNIQALCNAFGQHSEQDYLKNGLEAIKANGQVLIRDIELLKTYLENKSEKNQFEKDCLTWITENKAASAHMGDTTQAWSATQNQNVSVPVNKPEAYSEKDRKNEL